MAATDPTTATRYCTGPADDPTRYWVSATALEQVEAGGEGLVDQAHHNATGRLVALKLLTGTSLTDFERVAERARAFEVLHHPNLMEKIETSVGAALTDEPDDEASSNDFDVPFSVAEWTEGQPLLEAADDASGRTKLAWVADIADALAFLHGVRSDATPHGIVHRDVKPSNARVGRDSTAVQLDFGVARPVEQTDMTQGFGTDLWRAPEVSGGSSTKVPTTCTGTALPSAAPDSTPPPSPASGLMSSCSRSSMGVGQRGCGPLRAGDLGGGAAAHDGGCQELVLLRGRDLRDRRTQPDTNLADRRGDLR